MKHGFTLSEMLITLGVVGVVAAMTLPTLVKNYQKNVWVNQLKKVYTILNQAIKLSEAQNGEYIYWDDPNVIGAPAYFEKYFKPYMETIGICTSYSECGYKSSTPWISPNGKKTFTIHYNADRIPFKLKDGTLIILRNTKNRIWIDINGSKLPNKVGYDFFELELSKNGLSYPASCNTNNISCINNAGGCCAAKVIKDGWKINY